MLARRLVQGVNPMAIRDQKGAVALWSVNSLFAHVKVYTFMNVEGKDDEVRLTTNTAAGRAYGWLLLHQSQLEGKGPGSQLI